MIIKVAIRSLLAFGVSVTLFGGILTAGIGPARAGELDFDSCPPFDAGSGTVLSFSSPQFADFADVAFVQGQTYTFTTTFRSGITSPYSRYTIHAIIGNIPIPFEGAETPAGAVSHGSTYTNSINLPILSSYPAVRATFQVKVNSGLQTNVCLRFPAQIVSG
ncbi:hypothetical protein F5X71_20305 [Nocardia brasiliensis]|uniref:MD-2-related lipid-recognition domain-containing protein n=1 Tax=Nocardia brasiliensis TaxID=37326 RepID=A0A6G9XTY0_NOCBR|nr:ML domain-containing protein [Nocardia brasiliensis]QIS04357.1 hypothetical protein F5X71_20305 [Nocardia brasiliensis]